MHKQDICNKLSLLSSMHLRRLYLQTEFNSHLTSFCLKGFMETYHKRGFPEQAKCYQSSTPNALVLIIIGYCACIMFKCIHEVSKKIWNLKEIGYFQAIFLSGQDPAVCT